MSVESLALAPEIILTVAACVLFLWRPDRALTGWLATVSLLGALLTLGGPALIPQLTWSNTFMTGPLPAFFKGLMVTAGLLEIAFVHGERTVRHHYAETVALLLLTLVGGMLLVSARHLALAYVGFELVSVPSYALAGMMRGNGKSAEGGLKYAVFGGAASALMLYGFSLLYGVTGSLTYPGIIAGITDLHTAGAGSVLAIAALLIFAGVMYKLAAAPFHYWCPDAFEGAPTAIAGFVAIAPKIAGFGFLLQLTSILDIHPAWQRLLEASAFLSMIYGNVVAVPQMNVKRLLAYSAIAHAGYMLVAASLNSIPGDFAVLYYLTTYLFMNLGAFYVTGLVTGEGSLLEFHGLANRSPILAAEMAIFLLSLAGIPPFGGFVGKLFIISAAVGQHAWVLVGTLVVTSVVSLFYYARLLRAMYFESSPSGVEPPVIAPIDQLALAVMTLMTVVLGIAWGPLGDFLRHVVGL